MFVAFSRDPEVFSAVGQTSRPALRFKTLLHLIQGRGLDQEALPFIAAAGAAETHDDGAFLAFGLHPPRQRRIARRQECEIVEARTAQAGRAGIFHDQEVSRAP